MVSGAELSDYHKARGAAILGEPTHVVTSLPLIAPRPIDRAGKSKCINGLPDRVGHGMERAPQMFQRRRSASHEGMELRWQGMHPARAQLSMLAMYTQTLQRT